MRRLEILLLVVGVLGLAAIVREVGADAVFQSLRQLSWVLPLLLVFPGLAAQTAEAFAWRFAFQRDVVGVGELFVVRLAGEALNMTTPTANVGGEGVKAWLLSKRVHLRDVVPSLLVSKTSDTLAQALLLMLGLGIAWGLPQLDPRMLRGMIALLAAEVFAVVGFILFQISGALTRGASFFERIKLLSGAAVRDVNLDRALAAYYRNEHGRFALSTLCNLLSSLLGVIETYVIVRVLAGPTPMAEMLVVNAIAGAISFIGFFIPGQIAVREGAFVAAFVALQMDPAVGLSVGLAKRMLDLSWAGIGFVALARYRRQAQTAS